MNSAQPIIYNIEKSSVCRPSQVFIAKDVSHLVNGLKVGLINPKFEASFWGHEYALQLKDPDKRCWLVTGALPSLAALVPAEFEVEIFDENIAELDFAYLKTFDVVGVTGMITQKHRMLEILTELRNAGPIVVVGGPFVSVAENSFENLASFISRFTLYAGTVDSPHYD